MLGRGAWSVVYDASSARTGQPVALKMLLRGLPCGDESAEARFFREAKVTAALQHPHTVRVFDVGRTRGGALYLASERLEGPTLEAIIVEREAANGLMTPMEMAEILDGVLGSLAAGAPITARGVSLGTPDAMSPEQCANQELDGRSDLYSVAALLETEAQKSRSIATLWAGLWSGRAKSKPKSKRGLRPA